MSLAARCTACDTVFRVVQDQLKVADGWVRCGRCQQVFDARLTLFELVHDPQAGFAPQAASSPARPDDAAGDAPVAPLLVHRDASAPPAQGEGSAAADPPTGESAVDDTAGQADDDGVAAAVGKGTAPEAATQPPVNAPLDIDDRPLHPGGSGRVAELAERDRLEFEDARFNLELLDEAQGLEPDDGDASVPPVTPPADEPAFVQQAERRARRNSPRMRRLLAVAAVLLLATLALQAAHRFRDHLAARWPAMQPLLAQWCDRAGCRLEAPRRIEDIVVERSALTQIESDAQTMRLDIVMRNRGTLPRKTPSMDLSLSDMNGRLVVRRVLAPADFPGAPASIGAGAEAALALSLATEQPVSGYTVELFYP